MSIETIILLENINSPGDFISDKQPGAGYHQKYDNSHTFVILFNSFFGDIKLQGTLELFPGPNDWFDLKDSSGNKLEYGSDSSAVNGTISVISPGNFVWVRAVGTLTNGSIAQIQFTH
jgi:hypothetical protein